VSMRDILVTDTLFIGPEQEQELAQHGLRVIRHPSVTEEELCDAIAGKHGYILGGIEQVTERVIDNADELKAIVFTGAGYTEFIPAHEAATARGIAIANAPGGNAGAVAEFAFALMLAMTRGIVDRGTGGKPAKSLQQMSIGIVGLGHVGTSLAVTLKRYGVENVYYFSPRRKPHVETGVGIGHLPLEDLLRRCDVITLHTSKNAGEPFLTSEQLDLMPDGALLVNAAYPHAVDVPALQAALEQGRLRAAYDAPPPGIDLGRLSDEVWYSSRGQQAFMTEDALYMVSEMATRSLINLLQTGSDLFLVNPDYRGVRS